MNISKLTLAKMGRAILGASINAWQENGEGLAEEALDMFVRVATDGDWNELLVARRDEELLRDDIEYLDLRKIG